MEHIADDEAVSVFNYAVEETASVGIGDWGALREEAVSAQRLVVGRLSKQYTKGRMETAQYDPHRRVTAEKMFNLPRIITWVAGDPEVVVDELKRGRVRARLSAAMGLGKSVKLASYVAGALDQRVLHVALDAHALQQVVNYVHMVGLGRYRRHWSKRLAARVCCMTYSDFNGYMANSKRGELFASFDTIIFDEGFVQTAEVFVAKRLFSVYAPASVSLLVCSATISTDLKGVAESSSLGNFRTLDVDVSVETAISSGKLLSEYLVDRTMVVVPSDSDVTLLESHYEANGVDARVLHSATSSTEEDEACEWLKGDASTPRVLIVCVSYAIGYNFPIEYMILWPEVCVGKLCGDMYAIVKEKMTVEMIAQAKARTGRKIVDGSGGMVMSSGVMATVELPECERLRAFVLLSAAYVRPIATGFWASAYALFPDGLSPAVAHIMLKICLPLEVIPRYMCADGRVASRYCAALNFFSQPDHFLMASSQEEPDSFGEWPLDSGFFENQEIGPVRVPCRATGELQVCLLAITAMASGFFSLERWRMERNMHMGDECDSDTERDPVASRMRLRRLNVVTIDKPLPVALGVPWSYRPGVSGSEQLPRVGGYFDSDRMKEALAALERSLLDYKVPEVLPSVVIETEEGSVAAVSLGNGTVESPGGTKVCTLPVSICERVNMGQVLTCVDFLRFVAAYRVDKPRFVLSKLFDSFSGPWESVLRSLLDEVVIAGVVKHGVASDAYEMVNRLRVRFSKELVSVLSQSNVYKRRFLRVFSRAPSTDSMMAEIRAGRFHGVAQSDRFLDRVMLIKELIDRALIRAESHNVYLPTYITAAQRGLPVRGRAPLGVLGEDMLSMPRSVVRAMVDEKGKGRRETLHNRFARI